MFADSGTPLEPALKRRLLPPLETFPCPFRTAGLSGGIIRIVFPEFTCICPRTGYPDFASIDLYYLPGRLCIELKSWKLYLNSFRMIATFHETVTAHLFKTVTSLLRPRWALVVGDFFPRGNVDTTVVFETPGKRPQGADILIRRPEPRCSEFNR
jgi:7-cyano-7-deazaguanine reductase